MTSQKDLVCGIIVTYHPDLEAFKKNLKASAGQLDYIYIVDNSENLEIQKQLQLLSQPKIEVITLKANYGIAHAQNVGIEKAMESSQTFKFLFFLDQDTYLLENTVVDLKMGYHHLIEKGYKIACVGPSLVLGTDDVSEKKTDVAFEIVQETLSSGSLIPSQMFEVVGMMKAELFIDLVDWDWCWRAKAKGYETAILKNVIIRHHFGDGSMKFFKVGISAPIRNYYQFRNVFLMMKEPYTPNSFKIKYRLIFFYKFVVYSLFLKPRFTRFKYMVKGISDAKNGIYGKIDQPVKKKN